MNHTLNIPRNSTIIVGFSGGPDSLYLLLRLKEIEQSHNLKLIAAHLDHQWRPESGQELLWCEQICVQLSIEFVSERASNIASKILFNGSKEQHARHMRRYFFEEIATRYSPVYIALAHHKDDQIETFFIRLSRGASLQGLAGIKEHDGRYIRPLLNISKQEIVDYLNANNIDFLQDPSNNDPAFLRNRIRNQLIPILPSIDTRLSQNIFTTMQHFASVDQLLEQMTLNTINSIATSQNPLLLNTQQFLQLNPILQQRIILHLLIQAGANFIPSQALFAEIVRFLDSGKHFEHAMHPTYKIIKQKNSFSIIKL